jgi:hypothetical protein
VKCILCGTEDSLEIKLKKSTYFSCQHCELIFSHPAELLDNSCEHERYLRHENSLTNHAYRDSLIYFINSCLFNSNFASVHNIEGFHVKSAAEDSIFISQSHRINQLRKLKILDFGCGPVKTLAALLKELYKLDVETYDPYFDDKNLRAKYYDFISAIEVVEHFNDPKLSFSRLDSLMKKGTELALMTKFRPAKLADFKSWRYKDDTTHVSFYNQTTFGYLAEKFSWQVLFTNHRDLIKFKKL